MEFDLQEWWGGLVGWQQTVAILVGGVGVQVLFRTVILRGLTRMAQSTENDVDDRLIHFLRRFFGIALVFVVVLLILHAHGIEITPLLASAGIAGIALGLAAKETLADILAGIFLIADRPMRMGDRIKIERIGSHWGSWGDVMDIGLRRTMIRNTDGVVVNYPNSVLANSVITNFSYDKNPVRVRVRFQVNYDADLALVSRITLAAINEEAEVVQGTAEVVVRSLWDDDGGHQLSGVLVEGRYRILNVRERTRIRSRVLQGILKALQAADVAPATQVVRIDSRAS